MTLPDDVLADFDTESLYTRDGWFVHRFLGLDVDAATVTAELDTTRIGGLVDAQKEVAGHLKHVPAVVAIQMTGTLGQLFAVYGMGLRVTEGWSGYGTHIDKARFWRMGTIGPPVVGKATCTRRRQFRGTWFLNFDFELSQDGERMYTSSQMAAWHHHG